MVLDVEVDDTLVDAAPRVECIGDADTPHDRICRTAPDAWLVERKPGADESWGWPSMVRLKALPVDLFQGWSLMVEIDAFAADGPMARACLVPYSDGGTSAEPVCAESGRLTLDRVPEAAEDIASLRATVRAEFPDFAQDTACMQPCIIEGLAIDARL